MSELKKGLIQSVHDWSRVDVQYPGSYESWPPELGHDDKLCALAASLPDQHLHWGPIYGEEKTAAHRHADVFALLILNENSGLTVAGALAAGPPVISTKGGLGAASSVSAVLVDRPWDRALAAVFLYAMAVPREALKVMGNKGRERGAGFFLGQVGRDMHDVS